MPRGMSKTQWMTHEELVKEHLKLRGEYERTRGIVDMLVEKFEGHVHYANGESVPNPEFPQCKTWATSEPIKK